MTNLLANDSKNLLKTGKKNWLFSQEINAVPVSGSEWNEGYQPANKFLYISEGTALIAEKKLTQMSSLN